MIGSYSEEVCYDVANMNACHILLGRLWQYDLDALHSNRNNTYQFKKDGVTHVLTSLWEDGKNKERSIMIICHTWREFL